MLIENSNKPTNALNTSSHKEHTLINIGNPKDQLSVDAILFLLKVTPCNKSWKNILFKKSNLLGIMFIVDSSDTDRLSTAKEALYKYILECEEARNIPIFVVANKQDISGKYIMY